MTPKTAGIVFLPLLLLLFAGFSEAETEYDGWIQTNGPTGGQISDLAIDPRNPAILYAAGSAEGIYKTTDGGENWNLSRFPEPLGAENIEIDPQNPSTLYCGYLNVSKTTDGGSTWTECSNGFGDRAFAQRLAIDPANPRILYVGGYTFDGSGVAVFKTENAGQQWKDITGGLKTPVGSSLSALAVVGSGKLFIGVNDIQLHTWRKGKVFYSENSGHTWKEVPFGQTEDRYIRSIFVNPHNRKEIWISEASLYDFRLGDPLLYRSSDGGLHWKPLGLGNVPCDRTQVRVIGASPNGRIYVSGGGHLLFTRNQGASFTNIFQPSPQRSANDLYSICVHPGDPNKLYLPLRGNGIAYSADGGLKWTLKNSGLIATSMDLLAADPVNPSVIYATANKCEGIFRSDDYGENWTKLSSQGIVHPFGDELTIDPIDPKRIWFIGDVPVIQRSMDGGETWRVLGNQMGEGLGFSSVYALSLSADNRTMYGLNNGFGIFKGELMKDRWSWDWKFLNDSEVDYTYSIVQHPSNSNIVYSGYIAKPFQDWAMVRQTANGGETWRTALQIPNSAGVVSLEIDPKKSDTVYAGSIGKRGAIYKTADGGSSWSALNEHFIMCTIWGQSQLMIDPADPSIAYAATWLGGTWKTTDAGASWMLLKEAPRSATALSIDRSDSNVIFCADRSSPTVWKTIDAGSTWTKIADFSKDKAMLVIAVAAGGETVYASTFLPNLIGGNLYKSTNAGMDWKNITNALPKGVLDIAVDPASSNIVYATTNINGAYKSIDGGVTWMKMKAFPDAGAYDIQVDPSDPMVLYAAARGGSLPAWFTEIAGDKPDGITFKDPAGVYKSIDAGSTWSNLLTTTSSCRAIRMHPSSDKVLIAVDIIDGVKVSIDGGKKWAGYSSGLDKAVPTSVAIAGDKIYVGTQGCGVYGGDFDVSSGKVTWQANRSNKPVPEVYNMQIKVDPANSNCIFVSAYPGGLYRSDDGGAAFYDKNAITPSAIVEDPIRQGYYTIAINPKKTSEVWLGTWGKGIYKSYDGMNLDVPANGASMVMFGKHINQIVIDPDSPNVVYAATSEGVYTTKDGGRNWAVMNQGLSSTDVRVVSLGSNGALYAGTKGYGLFRWDMNTWRSVIPFGNWGVRWPIWNDRPLYQYTSMLIHPRDNAKMLIGTFPQGIYKSTDGGTSWRESNVGWTMDGVFTLVCRPQNPEIVYAGTYNGVNRSLDFGNHWELWDEGWPSEQWVFAMDFDPTNPDIMYACSKNGQNEGTGVSGFHGTVMKSLDGGVKWFEICNGLDKDQEFYRIIVDRFDPHTVYLQAQRDGMFISRDAGNNWTPWNEGLTNYKPATNGNNVTNALAVSADKSILYFGSAGSGVFRRRIAPLK